MTAHPMTPVDAAWYHMDGPENPATVTGIALTRRPVDFRRLRDVFLRRVLAFDRFRQRVVERGWLLPSLSWEDVPDFDIDEHLRRAALPAPRDEAALLALVSDLASTPLDRTRPLWQAHLIDHVDGGSALVLRYHHCIGDGTAMMTVAARLFDASAGTIARPRAKATPAPSGGLLDQAERVIQGAGSLLSELVKRPDPPSPFKGEFGTTKTAAWSQPVAIEDVKAIGAPTGAKVNDVLIAATAGALRAYLRQRGVDVDRTSLRAMVPVDLRPLERVGELGNEFGLVILDLPVSQPRAARRLALTQARMDALKRSPEAFAMLMLMDLFGRGPKALEDIANSVFGSKASVVMTNVVGPRSRVALAGVPVDRLMFCVPHPGRELGMGISIMSYRGMATLTVVADARLVPDAQAITRQFNREFERMRRRAVGKAASRARPKR